MSREFQDFLSSYNPDVQKLASEARALILETIAGVSEIVYPAMKVIRYGIDGNKMAGILCYLAPTKTGVNLGFHHGTSLPDPKGLLEGTGKSLRHVKLKKSDDVKAPALKALLKAELAEARRRR